MLATKNVVALDALKVETRILGPLKRATLAEIFRAVWILEVGF
jgi:hypothetical protein